ncbi:MAG TPA: MFS transporter, partial [Acidimicrobiales bacterium]|nr:MFS transporter [Acidimicrobiales bacterium]
MTRLARQTFASLAVPNYRRFFFGMLVSASGTWMQTVAQGWLVLELTGSGTAVGLVTAAQMLPMLVGGMWGGVVADRFDKRRTLLASQTGMAVVAASLAAVTIAGVVELWMVFTAAVLTGVCNAVDHPTRHSFVSELVGPDRLTNAVALNSAAFNSARTIGPGLAGGLILVGGTGTCFAVNAVSYLAVIAALAGMRTDELHRGRPAGRSPGQIRAGLRYTLRSPELRPVLLLVAIVGTFAFNFQVLLPLMARFTFDGGPGMLGLLTAVFGAGSVVGALAAAARGRPRPGFVAGACAVFGLLMLALAAAPNVGVAVAVLVALG